MSLPVCKFYSQNQTCRFGKHCRFSHSTSQRPPPAHNSNDFSQYEEVVRRPSFPASSYRDSGRSRTLPGHIEESVTEKTLQANQSSLQELHFDESGHQNVSANLSSNTVNQSAGRPDHRAICYYFASYGNCRYGRDCRFSHSFPYRQGSGPRKPNRGAEIPPRFRQAEERRHAKTQDGRPYEASDVRLAGISNDVETEPIFNQGRKVPLRAPQDHQYEKRMCPYFRFGRCNHGERCNMVHSYDGALEEDPRHERGTYAPQHYRKSEERKLAEVSIDATNSEDEQAQSDETTCGQYTTSEAYQSAQQVNTGVCRFFKSGYCNKGEQCRYLHLQNGDSGKKAVSVSVAGLDNDEAPADRKSHTCSVQAAQYRPSYGRPVPTRPLAVKQMFTHTELEEIGAAKLRESEISVIKKRFPQDKIAYADDDDKFTAKILFCPTDPDWPFDISVFELLVTLPVDYPRQMMIVQFPPNQDIPETVRRYTEVSIKEWLDHRKEQLSLSGKVELVFRPFLRWLDRNIENITTEALKQLKRELVAKAAGMEFIPAERLQAKYRTQSESAEDDEEDNDESEDGDDNDDEEEEEEEVETSEEAEDDSGDEYSSAEDGEASIGPSLDLDPAKKGTEVSLSHLQLRENASALIFERLKLILQCSRCKNHSELILSQGRVMSLRCDKCNQNQFVNFRAALIHQFSSIVGYLDMDGCTAFDLIFQDCRAVVTCMACNKQTRLDGLVTGQMVDGWCQACNARFKLATEAVKFTQLVPSGIDTANSKVVEVTKLKPKKPPKDPAIREGYPLPEFGTCKHYKHSYRWLRFPCCGKAYPCDVCHDKKEDHEMEMATRMICGHCCKEQNFAAAKPCKSCSQHLTKVRSAHWEGGSGCRDKITMSKNDQQKYRNMHKTQAKKKVQLGSPKKKNTKLRHA